MTLTIAAAEARIRRQLKDAETKADEALIAKLDLMASMVRARRCEGIGDGAIGQSAILRLSRAVQGQVDATNDLLRAHEHLRRDCNDAGFIPDEPKPLGKLPLAAVESAPVSDAA